MIRRFSPLVLLLCLAFSVFAQDARESRDRRALENAANKGNQLRTEMTVGGQVTAQAVLIPRVDARRIFGKEIADNYAVIEVNVGNKSPDAALIIHGIFIDYTGWALSGTSGQSQNLIDGVSRVRSEPFQASTSPNQVASEEYRVVRGQLLDAQMWSKRNWTMRLLTFAGNLVGAYAFSINEEGIVKGLNAFSGVFVPGIREVWPDGTIEQLNRISDFGYQTNKVIPRQGAEVIVCFFPIDRFLTPGFKKLFQKSPALFFAPLQMLVDKKLKKEADDVLKGIDSNLSVDELRGSLPCYLRFIQEMRFGSEANNKTFAGQMNQNASEVCRDSFGLAEATDEKGNKLLDENQRPFLRVGKDAGSKAKFKSFMALNFISQMSLNNVSVTIDGAMNVDTTTIAPKIDDVAFDRVANCGDDEMPCFWADTVIGGGVRTGTIPGAYMTGGSVAIADAASLGITELKTISEGSNDQELHFSFKLTEPLPPDTMLHFTVTKSQPGDGGTTAKTISSVAWDYRVGFQPVAPGITDVKQEGNKLTVRGSSFYDVPPTYPLVVELHPPAGGDVVEVTPTSVSGDGKQIVLTIPADAEPAGCWTVAVKLGALPASPANSNCFCFVVPPHPTLESAVRMGNRIIVTGTDLIDTRSCGGTKLSFQLIKEGGTPVPAKILAMNPPTQVALELTPAAKEGSWTVQVLLGGQAIPGINPVALESPQ